ncbi:MAG: hypothetical protein DELT_00260 [Desulfovibrio sp.]
MGNIALLLFCLLASGYVFWETGTYPPVADSSLDSALYPRALVCVLLFLTLLLAVNIYRTRSAGGKAAPEASPGSLPGLAPLAMVCCMAGYCVLLYLVGYAVATVCFVFIATLLFKGTPKEGLRVGIGVTFFLEALFRGAFQVPLPPGMFNLF